MDQALRDHWQDLIQPFTASRFTILSSQIGKGLGGRIIFEALELSEKILTRRKISIDPVGSYVIVKLQKTKPTRFGGPDQRRFKMKYNVTEVMNRAWKLFRKVGEITFAEALHRAWISEKAKPINAARIEAAKAAAGITEETNTWAGWKEEGFEVIHGSKALFGADLIWGSKGDGKVYKARFFGASQVRAIA